MGPQKLFLVIINLLVAVLIFGSCSQKEKINQQPNIIFIMSDDHVREQH